MTQRVARCPPIHARLIVVEEGPPMYRMLGYADKSNMHSDLCTPQSVGFLGPFSTPRLCTNQTLPFGPSRFGLPQAPTAYTTRYWDDRVFPSHHYVDKRPLNQLYKGVALPEERPEARCFPEMAVPGKGPLSRCKDSAYLYVADLKPPGVGGSI